MSNTIRHDGSRINTHNIGRNQSEKARKELEQVFGLVKAEGPKRMNEATTAVRIEKALYGKHETKQAISNAVTAVFNQYRFTSLPECNAALRQFNVVADRGKEGGRIYQNGGLVYRVLDPIGATIGVPIKASSLPCQPTLKNLEAKFVANKVLKEHRKEKVKWAIESGMAEAPTMKLFIANLEQQKICTVLRQNSAGMLYGITFVDNVGKCVFNGSDLGKAYSAAAIQTRLASQAAEYKLEKGDEKPVSLGGVSKEPKQSPERQPDKSVAKQPTNPVLDALLSTKEQHENVPANLLNKKRKKKRRQNNNS